MIYTNPYEVLKEAGFTPENFYIHPAYRSPASYIPVWHLLHAEPESEYKVTEVLK